jgi:N-acetylglutamate synthase-like GNAT family acetyltransferase
MITITIRDAEPADMAVLSAVFRRSSLSVDADRAHLLAHPETLDLAGTAVSEGRTRAAVASGRIIGFATWLRDGDALELDDLFVDPDWMGQGAGLALVGDVVARARSLGLRRVQVLANPSALGFYARAGFVAGDETGTRFGPAIRMHLELAE